MENNEPSIKEDVKALFTKLIDQTNHMGGEKEFIEGVIEALASKHRTLQASTIRCLLDSLFVWAAWTKEHDFCDLRNEAAVNLLCEIRESIACESSRTVMVGEEERNCFILPIPFI